MSQLNKKNTTNERLNDKENAITRYSELHGEPSWESPEQEAESWSLAANLARENRNEYNAIVKEVIGKRKEIMVQFK